jgi:hypothetical protein
LGKIPRPTHGREYSLAPGGGTVALGAKRVKGESADDWGFDDLARRLGLNLCSACFGFPGCWTGEVEPGIPRYFRMAFVSNLVTFGQMAVV